MADNSVIWWNCCKINFVQHMNHYVSMRHPWALT